MPLSYTCTTRHLILKFNPKSNHLVLVTGLLISDRFHCQWDGLFLKLLSSLGVALTFFIALLSARFRVFFVSSISFIKNFTLGQPKALATLAANAKQDCSERIK